MWWLPFVVMGSLFIIGVLLIGVAREGGYIPRRHNTTQPLHRFSLSNDNLILAEVLADSKHSIVLYSALKHSYDGANTYIFTRQGVQLTDAEFMELVAIVQQELVSTEMPSRLDRIAQLQSELSDYIVTNKYKAVKAQSEKIMPLVE